MHNLLVRQINKYFGEVGKVPEGMTAFVAAVDDAYRQFDTDRLMLERSLEINSREMLENNAEIARTVSLLSATLDATADGILVVDTAGKIESYNSRFLDLWHIPNSLVTEKDDAKLLAFVQDQLIDPQEFLNKVRVLYANPEMESSDVVTFKDGRIFERLSLPQKVGGKILGRVWSFRDVTEHKQMEDELTASEAKYRSLYSSMNEGVALHKLIYDDAGRAVDYQIIDVNPAYESITGLSSSQARGAKASAIYNAGKPPYLEIYERVVATGQAEHFDTRFDPMGKTFSISVFSPGKGQFATVFTDISAKVKAEMELKEKISDLEKFHDLTVGRELKMMELEKELERLKKDQRP